MNVLIMALFRYGGQAVLQGQVLLFSIMENSGNCRAQAAAADWPTVAAKCTV